MPEAQKCVTHRLPLAAVVVIGPTFGLKDRDGKNCSILVTPLKEPPFLVFFVWRLLRNPPGNGFR